MRLMTPPSAWTLSAGTRSSSPSSQTGTVSDEQTLHAPRIGHVRSGSLLIVTRTRDTQLLIRVCHIVSAAGSAEALTWDTSERRSRGTSRLRLIRALRQPLRTSVAISRSSDSEVESQGGLDCWPRPPVCVPAPDSIASWSWVHSDGMVTHSGGMSKSRVSRIRVGFVSRSQTAQRSREVACLMSGTVIREAHVCCARPSDIGALLCCFVPAFVAGFPVALDQHRAATQSGVPLSIDGRLRSLEQWLRPQVGRHRVAVHLGAVVELVAHSAALRLYPSRAAGDVAGLQRHPLPS